MRTPLVSILPGISFRHPAAVADVHRPLPLAVDEFQYTPRFGRDHRVATLTAEEEQFARCGSNPPNDFLPRLLRNAGPGKPGLGIVEKQTFQLEEDNAPALMHTEITWRDTDGAPVAVAIVSRDEPDWVIQCLGVDKSRESLPGNPAKQGLLAVMKAIDALDPRWIAAEPSSPDARRFILKYLKTEGRLRYREEVFHEGDFDSQGVWRREAPTWMDMQY